MFQLKESQRRCLEELAAEGHMTFETFKQSRVDMPPEGKGPCQTNYRTY